MVLVMMHSCELITCCALITSESMINIWPVKHIKAPSGFGSYLFLSSDSVFVGSLCEGFGPSFVMQFLVLQSS